MSKEKGLNITLGIQPGIAYALTPKIQLETGLNNLLYAGYAKTETKAGGTTVQKQSGFNASASFAEALQWNIGFRLLLGGS